MEKTVDRFETLTGNLNDALVGVKKAREAYKNAVGVFERAEASKESASVAVVNAEKKVKDSQQALNAFVQEGLVDKQ